MTTPGTRRFDPPGMMSPFSVNMHGAEVPPGHRLLFMSGQVGQAEDGTIPDGIAAQTELVWRNLEAVLAGADMGLEHLVHVNTYLTRREDLDTFLEVREPWMRAARPTATLVIVSGLANPDWLVEIEGYGAAPAA